MRNFSIAVREWKDEIVFLHKLVAGRRDESYGIDVARLAGLDKSVIARAKQILAKLESGDELGPHTVAESEQLSLLGAASSQQPAISRQPSAISPEASRSAIERALADVDLDGMSPREAHAFLSELQARLRS